jgi:hypothetical protein
MFSSQLSNVRLTKQNTALAAKIMAANLVGTSDDGKPCVDLEKSTRKEATKKGWYGDPQYIYPTKINWDTTQIFSAAIPNLIQIHDVVSQSHGRHRPTYSSSHLTFSALHMEYRRNENDNLTSLFLTLSTK